MTAPHTQCQPEADELRDYVVRRGGGFYRPRAQGYTQSIGEAGRWTRADANLYAVNCEGVTVHHVSEFPPDTIATLKAGVDELTKALEGLSKRAQSFANSAREGATKTGALDSRAASDTYEAFATQFEVWAKEASMLSLEDRK